jgi:hypothetical protein
MNRVASVLALLLSAGIVVSMVSCDQASSVREPASSSVASPSPTVQRKSSLGIDGVPHVEVGRVYKVVVGMAAISFYIIRIDDDGRVLASAVERADGVGIRQGSLWSLNLKQAVLVQAHVDESQAQR